jgi:hypothetical protein
MIHDLMFYVSETKCYSKTYDYKSQHNKKRPKGPSSCVGKEIEPGKSFRNQTCRDVFYNQHPYDLAFSLPPLLIIPMLGMTAL